MTTHISGTSSLLGFLGFGAVAFALVAGLRKTAEANALLPPLPLPVLPPLAANLAMPDLIPSHPVQVLDTPAPAAAIPVPSMSDRSAKQAATELLSYASMAIRSGMDAQLGTKELPSDYVAAAQRDMRGLVSDGVYGPKTMKRGHELTGISFPSRVKGLGRSQAPKLPSPASSSAFKTPLKKALPLSAAELDAIPVPPPPPTAAIEKPPAAPPSPATVVHEHSPVEAAAALFEYLRSTKPPTWGVKGAPNKVIQAAQNDMGGLAADGIYGPKTRARGKELLGKAFPPRI